jgi:hypothetical protein
MTRSRALTLPESNFNFAQPAKNLKELKLNIMVKLSVPHIVYYFESNILTASS